MAIKNVGVVGCGGLLDSVGAFRGEQQPTETQQGQPVLGQHPQVGHGAGGDQPVALAVLAAGAAALRKTA